MTFLQVRDALQSLSQRIIGSNTLVQGALPDILKNTPKKFFDDTIAQVQVPNKPLFHNQLDK
jgi:tyrosine aminotransferase